MRFSRIHAVAGAVVALMVLGAASVAVAQGDAADKRIELTGMGGVHALTENDTAIPDHIIDVPVVATLGYHLTPVWALEGEFTWVIPVEQELDLGVAGTQERKTPDILAYQANVRASLPLASASWSPYLAAGAGGLTFLSNTDSNRLPALDESVTMFALNFGGGLSYRLTPSWGLRGDFREFVAFPSKHTAGFSSGDEADALWMSRGTLGVAYRF